MSVRRPFLDSDSFSRGFRAKFLEVRQLLENCTGMVQNERSDALSRLGELQGVLEVKFLEVRQLPENGARMVQH